MAQMSCKEGAEWPVQAIKAVCGWHSEMLQKHLQMKLRQETCPGLRLEMLHRLHSWTVQLDLAVCGEPTREWWRGYLQIRCTWALSS